MSYEQNTLDLVPVIFAAGESKMFNMSGNYFELIDCPNPVDVVLSDAVGGQRVRMKQGEASFYSKGVSFSVVQITSATAQTVRFIYGTGEAGTRRSTGSVTISGAIALDAPTLAALEQISVRPEASTVTANFVPAVGSVTVIAPGVNTTGVFVQKCKVQAFSSTSQNGTLLAKTGAAPTSIADGRIVGLFEVVTQGANNTMALREENFVLAANEGLYLWTPNAISSPTGFVSARTLP